MVRARWLIGLSMMGLFSVSGCGLLPGLPGIGNAGGFALVVTAPDAYRGSGAVAMRFNMPRPAGYGVSAMAAEIERIDVTLTELGTLAVPPAVPMPMPGSAPMRPNAEPRKGVPEMAPMPAPMPPDDMEQWPTILPDVGPINMTAPNPVAPPPPTIGAPPSAGQTMPGPQVAPPPPRLEKPLVSAPPTVAQASISRSDLEQGKGDLVFDALKAGTYGIQMVAYGKGDRVLGRSMQSVQVLDGQTASVDATLVLDGPKGGGNVSVGVTIVEGGSGSSGGGEVATASPMILIDPALPPMR